VLVLTIFLILISSLVAETTQDTIIAEKVPEWGNVRIESFVAQDSIPQNDTLKFTVRLIIEGNIDDYAIADPSTPKLSNLELVGTSQGNLTESSDGKTVLIKEYEYYFTPVSVGMAYINPFRINYVFVPNGNDRNLSTTRFEVKVSEAIIQEKETNWGLIIGIVLLASIILVVVIILFSKKKRTDPEVKEIVISPEEKTRKLQKEIEQKANQDPIKAIEGLSKLINSFIKEKYDIDIASINNEELAEMLAKKGLPGSVIKQVCSANNQLNSIKFAGTPASEDDFQNITLALETLLVFCEKKNKEENNE